jgi:hypothetical protein
MLQQSWLKNKHCVINEQKGGVCTKLLTKNNVFNIFLIGILFLSLLMVSSSLGYLWDPPAQVLLYHSLFYALWMGFLSSTLVLFGVRVIDDLSSNHNWPQKTNRRINYGLFSLAILIVIILIRHLMSKA